MNLFEESLKRIQEDYCEDCRRMFRENNGLDEAAMTANFCCACKVVEFTTFMVAQAGTVASCFMPKPKQSLDKEVLITHACTHRIKTIIVGNTEIEMARRIRELTFERCHDCTMKEAR